MLPPKVKLIEVESVARSHSRFQKNTSLSYAGNIFTNYKRLYQIWINEYHFIEKIASQVDLAEFDILHIHESFPAIILNRKFQYQYVYTSHTPTWYQIYHKRTFFNYLKQMKINILTAIGIHEKNAIQNSSLTIGLGHYLKEQFNNANIKIIPNGIDLKKMETY